MLPRLAIAAAAAALLVSAASAVPAATPHLSPARAVAWLEANSDLQRPAQAMPQVRIVSDPASVRPGARYGAYVDGTVYLASWLPPDQAEAVLMHELVHWLQPAGCTGARELQAHTLTARWMARTGKPGPHIKWAQVRADAAACRN